MFSKRINGAASPACPSDNPATTTNPAAPTTPTTATVTATARATSPASPASSRTSKNSWAGATPTPTTSTKPSKAWANRSKTAPKPSPTPSATSLAAVVEVAPEMVETVTVNRNPPSTGAVTPSTSRSATAWKNSTPFRANTKTSSPTSAAKWPPPSAPSPEAVAWKTTTSPSTATPSTPDYPSSEPTSPSSAPSSSSPPPSSASASSWEPKTDGIYRHLLRLNLGLPGKHPGLPGRRPGQTLRLVRHLGNQSQNLLRRLRLAGRPGSP